MRAILISIVLLCLAACHRAPPTKDYVVHGKIVRIDIPGKVAVIDAEKIDGWMEAMTMDYPVHDPEQLKGLAPGDKITATVHVPEDLNYWIDHIAK
jgi:Cu/Ag efflux protein CusF